MTRRLDGIELVDEYAWLRQREDGEVLSHLEAENGWTERSLAHTEDLRQALYEEMLARIKEDDDTVPVRLDDYFYYSRTVKGKPYSIHCRRRGSESAPEEPYLDANELAEGHEYFRLGSIAVSPDHRLLAFTVDTAGGERFTLRVKDLESGALLADEIGEVATSIVWAADSRTLLYIRLDDANRPWQVRRHVLGTDDAADDIAFEEPDERFFVSVGRTRSRRFLLVDSRSSTTSETRYVDAQTPDAPLVVFCERREGIEYDIGHHGGHFYIRTNEDAKNFQLLRTPVASVAREAWQPLVEHRPSVKLEGVDLFSGHMVRVERSDGLRELVVQTFLRGEERRIELPEPVYALSVGSNPDYNATTYRFTYSSLVTPSSVYDYHVAQARLELRKRHEVLGGYDPAEYETFRLHASAADGTRIPLSVVHRRGVRKNAGNPCLLCGYGAYGISLEPAFSSMLLTLLDRGFVYVIAHVRGGGELGEGWHDAGKLEHKSNTFTDFIAAADYLVGEGWAAREKLAIRGGSAGGLLVGAVLNRRPDLCGVAIAHVPFVDVVNTMLDESLPLTVTEYEEWGDPRRAEDLSRMLAYSPYDNVRHACYPHLLVTAGLNDPRVQYWEPVKWVARLRDRRRCRHRLLLKVNMGAGHSGPSGRYEFLAERAFEYAFLLDTLGIR